jgi:hypothetical protein
MTLPAFKDTRFNKLFEWLKFENKFVYKKDNIGLEACSNKMDLG